VAAHHNCCPPRRPLEARYEARVWAYERRAALERLRQGDELSRRRDGRQLMLVPEEKAS
jgi:hypothetical protein